MEEQGIDWRELPIFANQPVLFNDLKWIYDAFWALSNSRQLGMASAQPILVSEVLSYCELTGIWDLEDREELLYFVQFLDKIFLQEMEKKKPSAKGSTK